MATPHEGGNAATEERDGRPSKLPSLLALLPDDVRSRLAGKMERVRLDLDYTLYEPDEPHRSAWFPLDCVASLLTFVDDGVVVEAGLVGREAFVGLPLLLGAETTPNRGTIQVPGHALRMGAQDFLTEATAPGPFRDCLLRVAHAHFTQAGQSAGCNARHRVDQRCARWLLMVHDRVDGDTFNLTQEYLAIMLGVRRATVTEAMLLLKEQGAVDYYRGQVVVRDRMALEAAACRCYGIVHREYQRLLLGDALPV